MSRAVTTVAVLAVGLLLIAGLLQGLGGASATAAPLSQYVDREDIVVTVAGATPVASQNSTREMRGEIKGVYVDYGPTISDTTDVTIKTEHAPQQTLMTLTDSATDAQYYPAVQFTGSTGSAISGAYMAFPIADWLNIGVAQSWTGTITVTVIWGD